MTTDPYTEAYDAFTATLDPITRDVVTKLMLNTRTRPDDPHMVGVCLTAIATIKSAAAQTQMLQAQQTTMRALEDLKSDARFTQGVERVATLKRSLDAVENTLRKSARVVKLLAGLLALLGAFALALAWRVGYEQAHADTHRATHQQICNDLNGYIAEVSRHWRTLHMTAAADRLATTYQRDCPR